MSLDTVELVMEFEDEFKITISDDEAARMQTVGDTFDFIVKTLSKRIALLATGVCPSARMFYCVRAGLQTEFCVARYKVRPSTKIDMIIPPGPPRSSWGDFARKHDLPQPAFSFFPSRRFPTPNTTIGDLIRKARPIAPKAFLQKDGSLNTEVVWNKVRQIVSEQLGVHASEILPHTHYINDLDCG